MQNVTKRGYSIGTLGWWMDERRGELGLTWDQVAERAGVSPETLRRNANRPDRMRTITRKGIERALMWESGSVDAILDGGEPTPLPEEPPEEQPREKRWGLLEQIHAIREQLDELERLTAEQQQQEQQRRRRA